jgi:hypothetical protein
MNVIPFVPYDDGEARWRYRVMKWKAALPLHYRSGVRAVHDYAEYLSGRRDRDFIVAANNRAIDAMISIYDICCDEEMKRII